MTEPKRHKRSAGLLLFRRTGGGVEVLLGHMGGPLWAGRDAGGWAIPKGEYGPDEAPRDAARREFTEELGLAPPEGDYLPLGEVRLTSGKLVTVWAVEADLDPALMVPGTFTMEWPPHSGQEREFPELDRVAWFAPPMARNKLMVPQITFLERLLVLLEG
ncbi:DNA mismatch repair protein MutT [Streptomyces lavendulae subsp. lavendulae]|uniref:NUDIX domain-containing protein n=1 Tax=Streptomyces lavendulae TaxID=1914 RepID=UPI0024A19FBB|nr:NUDIX domain-containing protein [Streptomyces lavendulae]GLV82110.1 DNA mismatch repair protein MutT [Streptomyces lavendulae subsp. lavendulae]